MWNPFKKKAKELVMPAAESWYWKCYDCDQQGEGTEEATRNDSGIHCITSGHSVRGGIK